MMVQEVPLGLLNVVRGHVAPASGCDGPIERGRHLPEAPPDDHSPKHRLFPLLSLRMVVRVWLVGWSQQGLLNRLGSGVVKEAGLGDLSGDAAAGGVEIPFLALNAGKAHPRFDAGDARGPRASERI